MINGRFRSFVAFCLMLMVFSTTSSVVALASDKKSVTGEITVLGHNVDGESPFIMLDGDRAFSGRTFFSSGTIATTENASANIRLGNLGFINLTPNSTLSLSFGDNKISGNLSAGQIKVFNNEGVEVKIQTPDGIVANEANRTGNFTVNLQSGVTKTSAENGSLFFNNGKTTVPVAAQQDDDDDNDGNSPVVPLLVLAGLVTAAVVIVVMNNDDDDDAPVVSPVR